MKMCGFIGGANYFREVQGEETSGGSSIAGSNRCCFPLCKYTPPIYFDTHRWKSAKFRILLSSSCTAEL